MASVREGEKIGPESTELECGSPRVSLLTNDVVHPRQGKQDCTPAEIPKKFLGTSVIKEKPCPDWC